MKQSKSVLAVMIFLSVAFMVCTNDAQAENEVSMAVNDYEILINFSQQMDPSTINDDTIAVEMTLPGIGRGTVAGRIETDDGSSAVFRSNADFVPVATYSIKISGVADAAGNLLESQTWVFDGVEMEAYQEDQDYQDDEPDKEDDPDLVYAALPHDYGFYWHGKQDDQNDRKQKFVPGQSNPYYNRNKPTVIFIHGWQNNSGYKQKANLKFSGVSGYDAYTHNAFIDKGWNVGIYHWEPFADECDVQWAEAKIWAYDGYNFTSDCTDTDLRKFSPPKKMRYRHGGGTKDYTDYTERGLSVAEMAYEDIVPALSNRNTGKEFRLAGHSLGNQMVTRLAELIYENIVAGNIDEDTYQIDRIALLDPAWTKNGKSYLGDSNGDGKNDWVGERCRWAIRDMIDRWDIAVEIYSSTALDSELFGIAMDANKPLQDMVCTVSLRPWYHPAWNLLLKHQAASRNYFWSMKFDPPVECTINWLNQRKKTGNVGPSASTSNSRIKQMMGKVNKWDQVEGRQTESPHDDWFEKKKY